MDDAPGEQRCLQVDVSPDEVDLVSGLLWEAGASAVQELDLGLGSVRLVAGIPAGAEKAIVERISVHGSPDVFEAAHDGWLDAWRPFARPVRVGRVVVYPPWSAEPEPADHVGEGGGPLVMVPIDPGRAFGQGAHVTTRLALGALQAHLVPGAHVLDVGCGSGVLGIVAARLGAGAVTAIDIEDEAVGATIENAGRNSVVDRLTVSMTPIESVAGSFDLVLANILSPVLVEVAPSICRLLGPDGVVVLTGMLRSQRDRVRAAYGDLVVVDERVDDDWCLLVLGPT